MSAEQNLGAYTGTPPVRRLGRTLRRHRRLRIGFTQLVYVVAGFALGLAIPHVPIGFTVPRVETTQMLFAVGAGILTFIGVVFSLLFLVVQFGATTFTPRLNLFYTSPLVWHAFSYYSGAMIFCFTAAFSSGGTDEMSGLVPVATVVLLLVAVSLYRTLQFRAFGSVQLASTLAEVTERGRRVLEGVYTEEMPRESGRGKARRALPDGTRNVVWTGGPGVVQDIDVPRIIEEARNADAVIEIVIPIGDTVQSQGTVAVIHGSADPSLDPAVLRAIRTGVERTFEQDPALVFRVLVDIALRALSPAVNDPTTAVQVVDSLESLLRMLLDRDLDVGEITGPRGSTRVLLTLPDWEDYVALSVDELAEAGAGHTQVRRRLERLLRDMIALAPESRRTPLQVRLDELSSRWPPPGLRATAAAPAEPSPPEAGAS
jgi:uncharacterized membrane protein